MSGHIHVCIIEFIKRVKENVRCETSLTKASHSFCLRIISEHECNIMFTI